MAIFLFGQRFNTMYYQVKAVRRLGEYLGCSLIQIVKDVEHLSFASVLPSVYHVGNHDGCAG